MDTSWSNVENKEAAFHRRRLTTIGSSDMPVIMGVSPYSTAVELWKIKTGKAKPAEQNFAMSRGVEMEPVARKWFNERMMLDFQPKVLTHPDVPAFTASMDGVCEKTNQGVEIKFSGKKDHDTAKSGTIPPHYLVQVQWQYIVSGLSNIYYLSYQENDAVIIEAPKPNAEEKNRLITSAAEFLEHVKAKTEPAISERDYMVVKSAEYVALAEQYKQRLYTLECMELEVKNLREQLINSSKILGHPKVDFGPCLVYKSTRVGAVEYGKVPALEGVDLTPYRKPDIESYTVKVKKSDE